MSSKNFVLCTLTCALFVAMLSINSFAQTTLLGESWKNSAKTNSQASVTDPDAAQNSVSAAWKASAKTTTNSQESSVAKSDALLKKQTNKSLSSDESEKLATAETAPVQLPILKNVSENLVLDGIEPPRTFQATAYSLQGRTRMGTYVRRGVIAADPRVLPLGSVVHLKAGNYSGVYTVHDTGSAIKGKVIDVWMPSSREARNFGRQNVRLTVLKYGGNRKPVTQVNPVVKKTTKR